MQRARGWTIGIAGVLLIGSGLAPPRPATASAAAAAPEAPGGALYLHRPDGTRVAAPLLSTDVDLRITGLVVRARVVQRFANPSDAWLEGLYVFPLPEMAAVDHLDMRVGARVIEGRIQERQEARRTFAKARREGRKASLVEQARPNLFTSAVANIGPGDEVEIAIEYQETLRYQAGRFRLRVPLVAAPRFEPGVVPAASPGSRASAAAPALWTPVPQPPVWHPDEGPRNPVRLTVEIDAGFPIEKLVSPSHVVFAQELAATRQRIYLQDYADRDFVLEWRPAAGREPRVVLLSEPRGEGADVLVMVMPPATAGAAPRLAREVVFVVDVSGSMGGASIEQARAALLLALERLDPGDRFNVIRFNHRTRTLFPASVAADAGNLARARAWVRRLQADGGTDMLPALQTALAGDDGATDVRQVVFITDGSIGNEAQLFAAIEAGLGRSRLFSVGIGSAPNGYFLKRAARFGRGTHTFVANPAEVDARMSELFARLESPVLSDLEVLWNDEVEMWPQRIPDLYAGEPVVVAARIERFVGDVVVRGRRGDQPWEVRLPLVPGPPERGIGVLWARRKIAALMDDLATGGDRQAVREAVVAVALEHHLVSKWTSLVAVDVTPARPAGEDMLRAAVPANLPAGWDPNGVLPRTATPAPMLRALGLALLAGALALARRRA